SDVCSSDLHAQDVFALQPAAGVVVAVAEIARFYGNYHSSRWLQGEYILRMNHPLNDAALGRLHEEYADLCLHGGFTQHSCCQSGQDDAELSGLPRLVFTFNARDHGRLRELVDLINDSASWARIAKAA